jgi:hypothetical protein
MGMLFSSSAQASYLLTSLPSPHLAPVATDMQSKPAVDSRCVWARQKVGVEPVIIATIA